jgi:hypothetical protein
MLGKSIMLQKSLVRTMGIEPDAIYDPATGKSQPLDANMVLPAKVFVNQGVPMTEGAYSPPMLGPSAIESMSEGGVQFNAPSRRSESVNAPFPKRRGDPFAGMGGM